MIDTHEPAHWRTLGTNTVYENRWVRVVVDECALPDGGTHLYTRLEPPGIGVGVIGFNDAGEVLLEREYRHGLGEVIWQLPGGLAHFGEDLQAAGLRELLEETGYAPVEVTPQTVRYLGFVWDNPAYGIGQSHAYAVWGLRAAAEAQRDAAEYLSLHWKSVDWLKEAVRSGEIRDRLVVAALAYLMLEGWI
jgi:8-oxo-dGTP pyrophosphatase MutT (NUDIX family)